MRSVVTIAAVIAVVCGLALGLGPAQLNADDSRTTDRSHLLDSGDAPVAAASRGTITTFNPVIKPVLPVVVNCKPVVCSV